MAKMKDVIKHHKELGLHFFDKSAMRFFNSKIETELTDDKYFITSESFTGKDEDRKYTVREYDWETGHISDITEFNKIETLQEAKKLLEYQTLEVIPL